MSKTHTFYGSTWKRGRRGELPRQIYSALVREIVAGRWSEGERLPSYGQLASETGLSRTPIESALIQLEEDGYIKRVSKKGLFLKTKHPGRHVSVGTVAVIADTRIPAGSRTNQARATDSFGAFNIDEIREEAEGIGLRVMPLSISVSDTEIASRLEALRAEPDFHGIISLIPRSRLKELVDTAVIPAIYLGVEDLSCSPCVVGNPYRAAVLLTEFLIQHGHRQIGFFPDGAPKCTVTEAILCGHRNAMEEAGLPCNETMMTLATQIQHVDVAAVKGLLDASAPCTAIIGGSIGITQKIVETADLLGMSIPDQLSLCSMQAGWLRPTVNEPVIGIRYDWHKVITTCFELLLNDDKKHLSRLVFNPEIAEFPPPSVASIPKLTEGE